MHAALHWIKFCRCSSEESCGGRLDDGRAHAFVRVVATNDDIDSSARIVCHDMFPVGNSPITLGCHPLSSLRRCWAALRWNGPSSASALRAERVNCVRSQMFPLPTSSCLALECKVTTCGVLMQWPPAERQIGEACRAARSSPRSSCEEPSVAHYVMTALTPLAWQPEPPHLASCNPLFHAISDWRPAIHAQGRAAIHCRARRQPFTTMKSKHRSPRASVGWVERHASAMGPLSLRAEGRRESAALLECRAASPLVCLVGEKLRWPTRRHDLLVSSRAEAAPRPRDALGASHTGPLIAGTRGAGVASKLSQRSRSRKPQRGRLSKRHRSRGDRRFALRDSFQGLPRARSGNPQRGRSGFVQKQRGLERGFARPVRFGKHDEKTDKSNA